MNNKRVTFSLERGFVLKQLQARSGSVTSRVAAAVQTGDGDCDCPEERGHTVSINLRSASDKHVVA